MAPVLSRPWTGRCHNSPAHNSLHRRRPVPVAFRGVAVLEEDALRQRPVVHADAHGLGGYLLDGHVRGQHTPPRAVSQCPGVRVAAMLLVLCMRMQRPVIMLAVCIPVQSRVLLFHDKWCHRALLKPSTQHVHWSIDRSRCVDCARKTLACKSAGQSINTHSHTLTSEPAQHN